MYEHPEQPVITRIDDQKLNNLTMAVYVLQAISLFVGVTAIVAVIVNYVKLPDVIGTRYESHFRWQIKTFWWALAGYLIGGLLTVVLVGFLVLAITWIWFIYRVVKGYLVFNDGQAIENR